MEEEKITELAKVLSKQIDDETFNKKYAPAKDVLKLIGAGVFLMATIALPNLPLVLKPFLNNQRQSKREVWKRFNVPYLKRTLQRLEKQKLIEIFEENGMELVKITEQGRKRILKMSLDELEIKKPKIWDGKWVLVSFDLPESLSKKRKILVEYLLVWGFYPLHKSVYIHAYPCLDEVDFLRVHLGISEYVTIFTVTKIENENTFKSFFGV